MERFREVAGELLELAGHPARVSPYGNVTLEIDGVTFSLLHDHEENDARMTMFCDFGLPDESNKDELIKALLAANAAGLARAGRESFCMNPVSGHILASSILPMPEGSARLLFDVLRQYAQQARKWQQAYALRTDAGAACKAS